MKRILLMGLLFLGFQSFAQDIYISSWVELTDIVLTPHDCIIKGEVEGESFTMPKPYKESGSEQYPNAQITRTAPTLVQSEESAHQLQKIARKNELSSKYGRVDRSRPRSDRSDSSTDSYTASVSGTQAISTGARYYVEEDSWWKTKDRTRVARHLVLVPAEQRGALWRTVTVIKPRVFWNGHKYADKFFTYEATEEYRFAGPLKIAALIGCLGMGLFAYTQSL